MDDTRQAHWDGVWTSRAVDEVSWFQREPSTSLRLLLEHGPPGGVVDVGAGASPLVDRLLDAGRRDVTLLDVAAPALDVTRQRLAARDDAGGVAYVVSDLLTWAPERTFAAWHDRAVLHFLTDPSDQAAYAALAARAVAPGGVVVVGAFAPDGPDACSGLPTAQWDADGLATLFADGFDLAHDEREEHVTPADVVQRFTWAVLRRR